MKSTDLKEVKNCKFHPNGHIHSSDKKGSLKRISLEVDLQKNSNKKVVVIGINPSTASEEGSDNTLTKTSKTMYSLGFGSLTMLNIYEHRETELDKVDKTMITDWSKHAVTLEKADVIFIAWGVNGHKPAKDSALKALESYKDKLWCVEKNGSKPVHPRVWTYDENCKIVRFEP